MGRRKLIGDEELLAVAREVFIEKGLAGSTREIARRAGISEAVIYQRHRTKAELFFRALVPPTPDIDALLLGRDRCDGPLDHLEQITLGMLEYFREIAPIIKPLMNHPDFNFEDFGERHPNAPLHALREGITDALQAQQDRGEIGPEPVGPAAPTLCASMYGLAWGLPRQAQIAARQAFFWTNTGPQHPGLNRGSYLAVERWERKISQRQGRLIGFCGPVFGDDDPLFRDEEQGDDGFVAYGTFRIPRAYWKVVVALGDDSNLAHRAFRFTNPASEEPMSAHMKRNPADCQVDLAAIEAETGLEFPKVLKDTPFLG